MNCRHLRSVAFLLALGYALAGCGESAPPQDGEDASAGPVSGAAPSVVHSASGTFNSIDRASHTINISHEPVPSAQWPAMTMDFQIRDGLEIADLDPGQRVLFEFSTDGDGTVTKIQPIP